MVFRKKNSLFFELILVVLCKVLGIALICFVFFGPETKLEMNSEAISEGILFPGSHQNNTQGEKHNALN